MNEIPSIVSLQQERFQKENTKNDIFEIVLKKCVEKILYTNKNTDKTYIIFEVPKILIGYPSYDMKSCLLFLINSLNNKGYLTEFIEPFYLYIDWGKVQKYTHSKIKINSLIKTNNPHKLKSQTKALLKQFPNTSKIEYVYEDACSSSSKKNKHVK